MFLFRMLGAPTRAILLHSLIRKASVNQSVSGFFNILIGFLVFWISASKVGVAKNKQDVLLLNIQILRRTLVFHYPSNILAKSSRKSVKSVAYPINSLKVDEFLPKSDARFKQLGPGN